MKKLSGMIVLFLLLLMSSPVSADEEATLEPIQGIVQIKTSDDDDWETITETVQVKAGDSIRTGESGWATLTFSGGTYSEILTNTELSLEILELPVEAGNSFTVSFGLLVGDTFNSIDASSDADSRFEITMPGMTATAHGTAFYTRVLPTGHSVVFTEEGTVETSGQLNEDNPVFVNSGEIIVYSIGGTLDEDLQPQFPTRRPSESELAPATCGDNVCQTGEKSVCELDCEIELENCGDGICDWSEDEGLLTCPVDCSSSLSISERALSERLTREARERAAANTAD